MKRVLSIQGGGIRGIIPCCALIELERQTGKLVRESIDFIGGTSTGALLAACVVAGIPAEDALKVYVNSGPWVFSPTSKALRYAALLADGHMFDNSLLHKAVEDTLGKNAGMLINDSPIGILITAADQAKHIWYFVKDGPTNARSTGRAPLVDAAVASACATTYHAPWYITPWGGPIYGDFSDGGTVCLADPVYETCVEAFTGYKCYGSFSPSDSTVISLGTGWFKPPDGNVPPPKGLLAEISWVTGSLVDASKTFAQEAAERQWPRIVKVFNPPLWASVDEADISAIPQLIELGQQYAAKMKWEEIL